MSRVSRSTNKTILVQEICDAAKFYKELLVGRKFLFIFDNRCIEVVFKRDGFKHLTGVSSNLTALSFYQKAVKGILRSNQVWFDNIHPFSLCKNKIEHIKNIFQDEESNYYLLEDIQTDSAFYKFGATESHFTLCMSIVNNTDDYIIQSLRDEACFEKSVNVHKVEFILSKQNNSSLYDSIIFQSEESSFQNLPFDIIKKINSSLV